MQKCCPKKYEEKDHCKKCDEAGRAKLVCACGNSIANAVGISIPALGGVQPYFLGSITIDDTNLCNPKTLISFSAVISSLATVSIVGTSRVNVYRTCKGSKQIVSSIPVLGTIAVLNVDAISFQLCVDNGCCDDCATYSFEFIPPPALLEVELGLSIGNVVISALTVERDC